MTGIAPRADFDWRRHDGVLFDLDGVITPTAEIHEHAWGELFADFDYTEDDYLRYIDGKPRYDGVRSFHASRNVTLPYGDPDRLVHPAEFLDRDTQAGEVRAAVGPGGAAVLRRDDQPEQAQGTHPAHDVNGEMMRQVPFRHLRGDLGSGEIAAAEQM